MKYLKNFRRNAVSTALIYTALLLTIVFGFSACSNNPKPEDTKAVAEENNKTSDNENKKEDAQFLVDAAEINLEEIKLGQLAQQNSLMPDVKELGKMMETEHTKCLSDLKALADKKAIDIPTSITKEGEDAYEKLINKSGAEFDKKYCDMMVDGHRNAISKFEKASTSCSDADIKEWAAETIPSLQKHLDHALICQKNCTKM